MHANYIEKCDELHAVTGINHVSLVCVTETWFKNYMADESVNLTGFSCERKDRVERRGGGVVSYVRNDVLYDRLDYLESDSFEVVWINIHPKRLPRRFSCVVVASIYHTPDADNTQMREYLINSLDNVLRKYPECGIILTGDFNRFRDGFLRTH